jgi:hypothetical protein
LLKEDFPCFPATKFCLQIRKTIFLPREMYPALLPARQSLNKDCAMTKFSEARPAQSPAKELLESRGRQREKGIPKVFDQLQGSCSEKYFRFPACERHGEISASVLLQSRRKKLRCYECCSVVEWHIFDHETLFSREQARKPTFESYKSEFVRETFP